MDVGRDVTRQLAHDLLGRLDEDVDELLLLVRFDGEDVDQRDDGLARVDRSHLGSFTAHAMNAIVANLRDAA